MYPVLLEGRAALVLATRLDKLFDREEEGLLVQGLLSVLMGVVLCLIVWFLTFPYSSRGLFIFWFITAIASIVSGLRLILRYRHNLSRRSNSSMLEEVPSTIYCPVCSEQNSTDATACDRCRIDLTIVRDAISPPTREATSRWRKMFSNSSHGMFGAESLASLKLSWVSS